MRLRTVVYGVNLLVLGLVGLALAVTRQDITDYRLGLAEDAIKEIGRQHLWLGALLIANLVTLIATLVVTLLTRRPRN